MNYVYEQVVKYTLELPISTERKWHGLLGRSSFAICRKGKSQEVDFVLAYSVKYISLKKKNFNFAL